ncbi:MULTISPECIES: hypothetical protein [Amycolatopsis]|nr:MULTISPECIES: hypothetical protein [Amycolatopsis]
MSRRCGFPAAGLRVLAGPGLGVEVDEEKLAFYAAKNEREGDLAG